ncbi:hypothetical protein E4U42_005817 [Claviceps africana]|uniref:Uncharacterized protein n=1 Tax=Claviceps africana TaxID=83212 RepID=A0A8K0NL76_9HYPO|nr:hypothetical protein E4U42_005817 [Claviceps africana]
MRHKWTRHQSSPVRDMGIDLLSTAFGLPSHRDIKRAERRLKDCVVYQYDEDDSDDTVDSILETDSEITYTSPEASPLKKRGAARSTRTSIRNSSRKRQQSRRSAISPIEKQWNVFCKGKRGSLSARQNIKEKKAKQSRSRSRERNKSPKPATPASSSPRLVKSQSFPENDTHTCVPISQIPLMMKSTGQFLPQTSSMYPQILTTEAHSVLRPIPRQPGNSGYGFPYHYLTPAFNEKGKQRHSSPAPVSKAQRLRDLQQHLNNAQERLSTEPGNSRLQQDRRDAQEQLNQFMDVLVAGKSQGHPHSSTTIMDKDVTRKKRCSLKDDTKENVAPNEQSVEPETGSPLIYEQQADQKLRLAVLRNGGPSTTIRHHLCSGCGKVRSQHFHEKNPLGAAHSHKPMLNYCSACRETRCNKNMMDRYHFCFGCGKVRSKLFQQKYMTEPGESLLPNYCGNCTNQARLMEDNNEASFLGAVIREPFVEEDRKADGVSPDSLSTSLEAGNSSPRQNMQAQKTSEKARSISQLQLRNKSPVKSTASPISPAESSPFYPGRRLGSAQRRAQRGSTPHPVAEHVAAPGILTGTHEYRIPYVEELSSETEPSEPAPLGANLETMDGEAKSTCREVPRPEESCKADVTMNAQNRASDEAVRRRLGSIASEEQTLKLGHQHHQAEYDDPGSRSDRSSCAFLYTDSDNKKKHVHAVGVSGNGNTQLEGASFAEEADEATSCRRSPLADFEHPKYSSYFREDQPRVNFQQDYPHDMGQPEAGQFSSSRGAFGRKEPFFSMFDYKSAGSGHSGSTDSLEPDGPDGHNAPRRSQNRRTTDGTFQPSSSDQDNSGDSSFSLGSSPGNAKSSSGQPAMKSTYSRSVFTDFSRSTNNPYYKPRRRQYPSSSEGAFHGRWDRSKRNPWPTTSRANRNTSFDGGIPEPIVEEPASAPPSPVQRTMLLEFKTFNNSHPDLPPETRDDRPSHNGINANGRAPPSMVSRLQCL